MDKRQKWILIAVAVLVVLNIGSIAYTFLSRDKIVYVDLTTLYGKFEYKLELEKGYSASKQTRQAILDTMEMEIQSLSRQIQNDTRNQGLIALYNEKRQQIIERSNYFNKDNEAQSKEYEGKIWTQLNQYISEFREANRYDFILGASGDGTIMASNPGKNVTDEMVRFANKRYHGK